MSQTDEPRRAAFKVRPYTVTGGRTRSEVDLALETLVQTSESGLRPRAGTIPESVAILEMATEPLSVAEVSAHIKTPLQVTKILVGDLVTAGYLSTHDAAGATPGDRPDLLLLERVLDGLQTL